MILGEDPILMGCLNYKCEHAKSSGAGKWNCADKDDEQSFLQLN